MNIKYFREFRISIF